MSNKITSCDGECFVCKNEECIFVGSDDVHDDAIMKLEYKEPKEVPPCLVYYTNTPDYGEEFDCEYDVTWFCEECLCNWKIGGWKDPRTPEKYDEE